MEVSKPYTGADSIVKMYNKLVQIVLNNNGLAVLLPSRLSSKCSLAFTDFNMLSIGLQVR